MIENLALNRLYPSAFLPFLSFKWKSWVTIIAAQQCVFGLFLKNVNLTGKDQKKKIYFTLLLYMRSEKKKLSKIFVNFTDDKN